MTETNEAFVDGGALFERTNTTIVHVPPESARRSIRMRIAASTAETVGLGIAGVVGFVSGAETRVDYLSPDKLEAFSLSVAEVGLGLALSLLAIRAARETRSLINRRKLINQALEIPQYPQTGGIEN